MDASASASASAAVSDGDPLWDWDNFLDFAIHDDDDSLLLPCARPDSMQSPFPAPSPPPPSPPPPPPPPVAPESGAEAGDSGARVRKRDPRLVCTNYLAGRVPCACPEVDEMAAAAEADDVASEMLAGARKRARARSAGGAVAEIRCQVPGCEVDIRELKGYHRRHRVCLRCAQAMSVLLDGVHKRYCQQCGKFHVLPDFDEGKRSCRRKLERHNKRRRRRPDSKNVVEKQLEDQLDLLADVSDDGETREEVMNGMTTEMIENFVTDKNLDRETSIGSEDGNVSPACTLPGSQNDQGNSTVSFAASVEVCVDAKADNAKISDSPVFCDSKSAYSSPCPTGRISFKLYDWNPAEFPRRLRHQIFQWLASMPVELEGYIRPGCTILTVFIAMPQFMWDKICEDSSHHLMELVNAPNSLFLGKGAFFINLNNMVFQISKDGSSLKSIKMNIQTPKIHYVHPTCFEIGKPVDLVVCGSYLDQPEFRSLVSFNGKYLKHNCHRVPPDERTSPFGGQRENTNCAQQEIFRISIAQTSVDVYGAAFIEVETASGLSNFIPILFGSEELCSELNRIFCSPREHSVSGDVVLGSMSADPSELFRTEHTAISEFLLEIGWLLKKPCPNELKIVLNLTNIQRWTSILRFLIQNELLDLLEIFLHTLDNLISTEVLSELEKGRLNADVVVFLKCINNARIIHHKGRRDVRQKLDESQVEDSTPENFSSSMPSATLTVASSEDNLCSTSIAYDEEETVALLTKRVANRQCCHPQLHAKWQKHSLLAAFPSGAMRTRIVMTLTVAVVVCLAACTVLLHPHKGGVLLVPVKRYLFGRTIP